MKHVAQKARREVEAKVKEKAKKRRTAEEKKKKKKMLEYIQRLWDKVIAEDVVLLEGAKRSQVTGFKYKEIAFRDKKR